MTPLNVLLIGSGGREHALAWAIAASPLLGAFYCAPGNPGIAEHATCVALDVGDHQAGEQDAREGNAAFRHAGDRRLYDLRHDAFSYRVRHDGGRRIGAHAAGIGASVAIANAFVILCRG